MGWDGMGWVSCLDAGYGAGWDRDVYGMACLEFGVWSWDDVVLLGLHPPRNIYDDSNMTEFNVCTLHLCNAI